jgi:actin-related protein
LEGVEDGLWIMDIFGWLHPLTTSIFTMYCGDETGSFIGDVGSSTARFGYGGDNAPSYVVPSMIMATEQENGKILRSTVPTSCYNYKANYDYRVPMRRAQLKEHDPDDAMDVVLNSPMTDPISYLQQGDSIADWDAYEQLWLHALDSLLVYNTYKYATSRGKGGGPSTSSGGLHSATVRSGTSGDHRCVHPFLVVSPGMTPVVGDEHPGSASRQSQKEMLQLTEIMIETLHAPALFIAPTPMLAAFAHGRQSALVVDVGAGGTRVTPVIDGLLLRQAQRRTGRGTDWLNQCIWQALRHEPQRAAAAGTTFHLTPRYQVPPKSVASHPNGIFHRWAMNDLMHELRTSEYVTLPQWWYDPTVPFVYDDDDAMNEDETTSGVGIKNYYELPDGTSIDLSTRIGKDICRVPELFFSETCPFSHPASGSSTILQQHPTLSNLPLHQLIHQSLSAVADVDARRDLAATVVLTGGGAGGNLASRLSLELSRIISSAYKPKVLAATSTAGKPLSGPATMERQCAAWIGGSILTSLGSFQQLWLSKAEYEEYGGTLAIQRFP